MKKLILLILVFALIFALAFNFTACGEDNEPTADEPEIPQDSPSTDEPTDEPEIPEDSPSTDEPTDEPEIPEDIPEKPEDTPTTDDEPTDEPNDEPTDEPTDELKSVLTSKVLTVDGNNINGKLSHGTEIFNFASDISVENCASWVVSIDVYGMMNIATKTAPLNDGNNIFYIHVTNKDDTVDSYTVNIYRNHMYTVSFNTNGGTQVDMQYIEEDTLATEPTTSRIGYTFNSWDYDFKNPIKESLTVNASWTVNTDTKYTVKYFLQNFEDDYFPDEPILTLELTGTTNAEVEAEIKEFEHYTYNSAMSFERAKIKADGSLVLRVYYMVNVYSLKNTDQNLGKLSESGKYKYGSELIVTATPYLGHEFLGWYSGEELISAEPTYTFKAEKDIEARFGKKEEMQIFDFFATESTCTIMRLENKTVTEVVIPDYVTEIGFGAFKDCILLESVVISDSVETLGPYAFENCESLCSLSLGSSIKIIDECAFYNCTSLTRVVIPDRVENVGSYAFKGCTNLSEIIFGSSIKNIGESAFSGCTRLTRVEIPDGVEDVKASTFENCTKLSELILSSSIKTIGYNAFRSCQSLISVTIPEHVEVIGDKAFYNCNKLIEVINLSTLNISLGTNDYGYVAKYAKIVHNGESKIVNQDDYLFFSLDGANYIVGYIGSDRNLELPESYNGENYELYPFAFYACDRIASVLLSDTITKIPNKAFASCTALTTIRIPYSITSIDEYAFSGCNKLIEIINLSVLDLDGYAKVVHNEESKISNISNYLFITLDGVNYLINYIGTETELSLPESYYGENYSIYKYAFRNNNSITSVVIPDSVEAIGEYAFYNCISLSELSLGRSIKEIGFLAFYNCIRLESIELPDSVVNVGPSAFASCLRLSSVTFGTSLNIIKSGAFHTCISLERIETPDGLETIESSAFENCTALSELVLSSSLKSIGQMSFYDCFNLKSIKYRGTESQWESVSLGEDWNFGATNVIVYDYVSE